MTKKLVPLFLIIYLLTTGVSFAAFRYLLPGTDLIVPTPPTYEDTNGKRLVIDPSEPKTESCPINGEMYTKTEQKVWETRRPMLVMIENHLEARPQSGIDVADVIYEAIAEGGITRFMGVYYCDAVSEDSVIGPVRSARTYFLDWASEYSLHPIYVHVGGANTPNKANALGQIIDYGWGGENDLNQFALTVKECWRDYSRLGRQVATEHTMYCSTEALWEIGAQKGWAARGQDNKLWADEFSAWKFADPKPVSNPAASEVKFDFWEDFFQYTVVWKYDAASNKYLRETGGDKHTDNNSKNQIAARVVVIQFVTETGPIDDHKHMLYGTIGSGEALIFQNGEVLKAKWAKAERTDRTVFTVKGKEVEFARGKIWIEAVPKGNTVSY